jgi:hypothetical protein
LIGGFVAAGFAGVFLEAGAGDGVGDAIGATALVFTRLDTPGLRSRCSLCPGY